MSETPAAETLINFYSPREELLNTISHGLGAVAVLTGIVILGMAAHASGTLMLISVLIYSFSLLTMYVSSTIYHAAKDDRMKLFFRRLDYCSIYLLIAGTYTPLMLSAVGGAWGWGILIAVWALAGIGIVIKCFSMKEYGGLSLYLHLIMGWLCVLCIRSLFSGLTTAGLICLIAGGLFYMAGIVFFLDERPYRHAIWHLFVLAGTTSHFFTVWELL